LKEDKNMDTLASLTPVQLTILVYFICIIISFGVAFFIRILFNGIKWQRRKFRPVPKVSDKSVDSKKV